MISVCMATFNGCLYIQEQLVSILQQLSEKDEVVIVDDHSNDNTVEIVQKLKDKRIRTIENQSNVGPIRSFQRAIENSRGDYIFFADQDDIWLDGKIDKVMKSFKEGADLVVHDSKVTDANLKVISNSWNNYNQNKFRKSYIWTIIKNPFTGADMAITRNILRVIMPFPKKIPMHDWWIGCVCQKMHLKICILRDPLILYRRHGNNVTGKAHQPWQMIKNRLNLVAKVWRR
ncbi:Glycosyltransferase-like protein [Levilactobacillus brevis KB290]|uniref:Glycosyltransferase-like protein n=2 Tax=Levilactobacillus brevis TaxID=1580 RepID=M5AEN1_LEVBR|nr:Glycosyltransferase-like protein [Levilactobacillus brevis]BAN07214.1 Glycosyltransferase-like protein [Levilactobacillus brevis KB290]